MVDYNYPHNHMLVMDWRAILLILAILGGEVVRTQPQFGGGGYGMGGLVMMGPMDGSQAIIPVNGANPFSGYGMQQYGQQQMVRSQPAGGFQQQQRPQQQQLNEIYQQQQLIQQQMMQQQQQRQQQRLQQIRPVANFQTSFRQSAQGFLPSQLFAYKSNYGGPSFGQPSAIPQSIQPLAGGPPLPISPASIPMQVVIGKQTPDGVVAYGSNTQQTSFQTEDQLPPSPSTPGQSNSELPRFLEGAGPEVVDQFKQIIRQPNTSYSEQVKRIDDLVQKLDQPHRELYKEFMKENDDRELQHRDKIHQTVAKMSDKAQEQFAKISAILRNPGVPDQERWDRVLNLYGSMDPELRNEFEQKFKGFGPTPPNYFY